MNQEPGIDVWDIERIPTELMLRAKEEQAGPSASLLRRGQWLQMVIHSNISVSVISQRLGTQK